jgi:hypothetical protein
MSLFETGILGHLAMMLAIAAIIFCVVYFGTIKFWELLTGDRLQKPIPAVLAVFLSVRLTVECARMLMWRVWWW